MKKTILLFTAILMLYSAQAQHADKCGTNEAWEMLKAKDPDAQLRMEQLEQYTKTFIAEHPQVNYKRDNSANASRGQRGTIVTIPVVVHVIHHGEAYGTGPNITDDQIYSQIDALNADFRLLNSDSLPDTHPFWTYTMDCNIEFCLAQRDPNGNATTGIVRVNSSMPYFTAQEFNQGNMRYTQYGGDDNWDPIHYLNVWTVKLEPGSSALGIGTFPSNLASDPDHDGVGCRYDAFGTVGPDLISTNALGRTMTHEVGHWLNLKHIWGDDSPQADQNGTCDAGECDGTDECGDTPPACEPNYGCTQSFPFNAFNPCGSDADGEMYMNFMDYGDDPCIVMFTYNQYERTFATLSGPRVGILSSQGCQAPTAVANVSAENNSVQVSPNPSKGNFSVHFSHEESEQLSQLNVTNDLGMTVASIAPSKADSYGINLGYLPNGIYFLHATVNGKTISKKLILAK